MRGNTALKDNRTNGTAFPAAQPNAEVDLTTSADDDAIYDLCGIAPPASASATKVAVGYQPLLPQTESATTSGTLSGTTQAGVVAFGDPALRQVTVNPIRLIRSAISNSTPRAILSTTLDAQTTIATPSVPGGYWQIDMLCGVISWVDPSNHSSGTVGSLVWATSPTPVTSGTAVPNVASAPIQVDGAWVVPLLYFVNYASDVGTPNHRIISGPIGSSTNGGTTTVSMGRIPTGSQRASGQSTRGFAAATNALPAMLSGSGPFASAAGNEFVSLTGGTPGVIAGHDQSRVVKDFRVPVDAAHSSGDFDLDDTQDWRNANFYVRFIFGGNITDHYGEDDQSNTGAPRQFAPYTSHDAGGGPVYSSIYHAVGNSFQPVTPNATTGATSSKLWAGIVSPDITQHPVNASTGAINISTGNYFGIYVDPSTGKLRATRSASGGVISSYWIIVEAFFPNRPR